MPFIAMISVAEQFSNLRNTLGSILGIFTLLRWARTIFAKLTGRPPPADATSLTPSAFAVFQGGAAPTHLPDGTPLPPRPSKKPFLVFLLAAVGLPYLMGKLIRALARSQEEDEARRLASQDPTQQLLLGPDGRPLPPDQQPQTHQPLDPSKLDFCRLLYDYTPENSGQPPTPGVDIEVKKGDLVAVLSKTDPMGNESQWWRCRARDGRVGYLPSPWLETIQRRREIAAAPNSAEGGGRAQTMTSTDAGSRTQSLKAMGKEMASVGTGKPPIVQGKMGDISAESFQKSQFYS